MAGYFGDDHGRPRRILVDPTSTVVAGFKMVEEGHKLKKPTKTSLKKARNRRKLERARATRDNRKRPFDFMALPVELRLKVYVQAFTTLKLLASPNVGMSAGGASMNFPWNHFSFQKQTYLEAAKFVYYHNTFAYSGPYRRLCSIKNFLFSRLTILVLNFDLPRFPRSQSTADHEAWQHLIRSGNKLQSLHLRVNDDLLLPMHVPISRMLASPSHQSTRPYFELELKLVGGYGLPYQQLPNFGQHTLPIPLYRIQACQSAVP